MMICLVLFFIAALYAFNIYTIKTAILKNSRLSDIEKVSWILALILMPLWGLYMFTLKRDFQRR